MITRGLELYKKDYRAVVMFLKRNAEVLGGKLEAIYSVGDQGSSAFKNTSERVRKQAEKLLFPRYLIYRLWLLYLTVA